MLGKITAKRAVKRSVGWSAILAHMISGNVPGQAACILYYHRVSDIDFVDPRIDDHNVLPARFEQHIAALAESAGIVSLPELPERLRQPASKPLVCLTFDDGYANFYSNVLPVLKRYNAPATLSVVTGSIGSREPAPFDKWGLKNCRRASPDAWRPLNWAEIEECVASGLVTLGAHSHRHLRANDCTPEQIREEVSRSAEILFSRFGDSNVPVYAYPYGNSFMGHVPAEYLAAVRDAGFKLAVTTDFGHVGSGHDSFLLPRVEAHGLDSPRTLRAKVQSRTSPYFLHDRIRASAYRFKNRNGVTRSNAGSAGNASPA